MHYDDKGLRGIWDTKGLRFLRNFSLAFQCAVEKVSVNYDSFHKFKNNVIAAGPAAPFELPLTCLLCEFMCVTFMLYKCANH